MVGSIGSLNAFLDESLAYEAAGLQVEVFATGALKGTGMPGTKLSEAQREYMQGRVDKYGGMFKDHVRAYRVVEEEAMQGQVFIGSEALEAGLVDVIVQEVGNCLCVD